jgi:hypothetical protein
LISEAKEHFKITAKTGKKYFKLPQKPDESKKKQLD